MNILHATDFYKVNHFQMYPKGLTKVYSNFTPRASKLPGVNAVVVMGVQAFVQKFLVEGFNEFFASDIDAVCDEYTRRTNNACPTDHLRALYKLGYLPLLIKALPEGALCPIGVPCLTITNTHPDFAWLPNFLETLISCELWHIMTSATIAREYRVLLQNFAIQTCDTLDLVKWQAHDFSMRGHTSLDSAAKSGAGHLMCFTGTDTVPALDYLDTYYGGHNSALLGGSVPATEHSVMCAGGEADEIGTFRRLMETFPTGILSAVSDTWDYWKVLAETLPTLKAEIMARPGKLVIRPDSGDPVKIICGDPEAVAGSPEYFGSLELLWQTFGGTLNAKGFRVLDEHIGLIYGDSITLTRAQDILTRMRDAGFASSNIVFGVGSYTYQYVTRDTFGFAMKATYIEDGSGGRPIFKAPKTDNGVKKSAKGLLGVFGSLVKGEGGLYLKENVESRQEQLGWLFPVFQDGVAMSTTSIDEIRNLIEENL